MEKLLKIHGLIISSIFLFGCANTPNDFAPKYHKASKSIKLVAKGEKPNFKFKKIKSVASNSCDSKTVARVIGDKEEAILVLKLETAKLGGNAVINYSCSTLPIDLINNCWVSRKCEGDAVIITKESS